MAVSCRAGREAMIAFCDREGIAYDLCGKVIVAVDEAELSRLEGLVRRGTDNGVSCELVSHAQLRDLEPHAAGIGGILVHDTGIVDYKQVCAKLVSNLSKLTDCDGENSETDSSLDFARDCGYITAQQHRELTGMCQEVGKMLGSIINNPPPSCSLPPDL